MAINSNGGAFYTADTLSIGSGPDTDFFKVTVKDTSGTAVDIDGESHKDGIVDRILQAIATRGTIKYYNVTTTNGVIHVAVEQTGAWSSATVLQTYLRALGGVSCKAGASSTSDDSVVDVGGTDVATSEMVLA